MAKVNLSVVDDGDDLFDELIRTREQVTQQVAPSVPQVVPQASQVVAPTPTVATLCKDNTDIAPKEIKHKNNKIDVLQFKILEETKKSFLKICNDYNCTMTEALKGYINKSIKRNKL